MEQVNTQAAAITSAAEAIGLDTRAAVKLVDLAALNDDGSNAAELVQAMAVKYPGLVAPVETAQPAPAKRTDDDRRRDYFMGGSKEFFNGGGVKGVTK